MENKGIIYEIKSKYILKHVLTYISDINFELKLFNHSKNFQNKLNTNFTYCYQKYLNSLEFDVNKYLYIDETFDEYCYDMLSVKYDNFLSDNKLNKEKFENILYEVLNYQTKEKKNKYIDIYSPLFEIISKSKDFDKYYIINISQKNIDKYKLKDNYRLAFKKLNNTNSKYSSICYTFKDKTKLHHLKELNINYNNIRKLKLIYQSARSYDEHVFELFLFNKVNNIESTKNTIDILNLFVNLEQLIVYHYSNIKNILQELNFNELKKLKFSCSGLSDIKVLEKVKFNKLEKLNLCINHLSDINILENVNFKELKKLDLSNNEIEDIKVIEKVKFDKLETLFLDHNKISDINILKNANFKEIKVLDLSWNPISDIKILGNVKFDKLEKLNLSCNKISDIKILGNVKFDKLEKLNLSCNKISDINILKNANFKEIKELNLRSNEISDIKVLEKVKFNKLKKLNLSYNQISDINILTEVNLSELKELDLYHNKISDINALEKIKFPRLEKLVLGHNQIRDKKSLEKIKFIEINPY